MASQMEEIHQDKSTCFCMGFCERKKTTALCLGVQFLADVWDFKDFPVKSYTVCVNRWYKNNTTRSEKRVPSPCPFPAGSGEAGTTGKFFSSKVMLGKACCWNILPFFPSTVFQDCSDLVLLWPQETEKKKLMKKEGEIQQGGCFPVVAACSQSDSGNLYWIWKLLVPKSCSITMQGNGISQCQGPFVDPCKRAGCVAFILEAPLCLVQSLFVVF